MPFMIALLTAAMSGESPAENMPGVLPLRPFPADRFYPDIAQRMEVSGWATLRCVPQSNASLQDCQLVGEGPAGVRFGEAALRMAPYLRVALKGKALNAVVGQPAETTIRFQVPSSVQDPPTVRALSAAAIDAARPSGAPQDGVVRVVCQASLAGGGPLTNCTSGFEAPRDVGFGKAAADVAARAYVSTLDAAPRRVTANLYLSAPTAQGSIQSPDGSLGVRWPDGVWPGIQARIGDAATALASNPAVFDCDLDPAGTLAACTPKGEIPAAALAASQALLKQAIVERKVYFNVVWSGR